MKTIPLRQLLREPSKVKKWTQTGQSLCVTDRGEPLWIVEKASSKEEEKRRKAATEEILNDLLKQPVEPVDASRLILESRA